MNETGKPSSGPADPRGPAQRHARKPYEKPAFVKEQLFETMALACGKANTTIAQCRLVKKNS